jgi:hypothetical protein
MPGVQLQQATTTAAAAAAVWHTELPVAYACKFVFETARHLWSRAGVQLAVRNKHVP